MYRLHLPAFFRAWAGFGNRALACTDVRRGARMTTLHNLMKKMLVVSKPRAVVPRLPRPSMVTVEARHQALYVKSKTKNCCF